MINSSWQSIRDEVEFSGTESLEQLATLTSTLFSPILNRGQEPVTLVSQHPFGPNEKSVSTLFDCCVPLTHYVYQTLITVQAVRSFCSLDLSFPLLYQLPYWRYKPALFLGHLVGHEGPGSLHSYLTRTGWITSLDAGPYNLARGFAMFKVTVRLTKEGFRASPMFCSSRCIDGRGAFSRELSSSAVGDFQISANASLWSPPFLVSTRDVSFIKHTIYLCRKSQTRSLCRLGLRTYAVASSSGNVSQSTTGG